MGAVSGAATNTLNDKKSYDANTGAPMIPNQQIESRKRDDHTFAECIEEAALQYGSENEHKCPYCDCYTGALAIGTGFKAGAHFAQSTLLAMASEGFQDWWIQQEFGALKYRNKALTEIQLQDWEKEAFSAGRLSMMKELEEERAAHIETRESLRSREAILREKLKEEQAALREAEKKLESTMKFQDHTVNYWHEKAEKLQHHNEILVKALGFYADKDSWFCDRYATGHGYAALTVISSVDEECLAQDSYYGGKRAREALTSINAEALAKINSAYTEHSVNNKSSLTSISETANSDDQNLAINDQKVATAPMDCDS
jgi:hypothetical protein